MKLAVFYVIKVLLIYYIIYYIMYSKFPVNYNLVLKFMSFHEEIHSILYLALSNKDFLISFEIYLSSTAFFLQSVVTLIYLFQQFGF